MEKNSIFSELDDKDLLRLHDVLNKALGRVYDTVHKQGIEAPVWLVAASSEVREMYAEIWARRNPAPGSNGATET